MESIETNTYTHIHTKNNHYLKKHTRNCHKHLTEITLDKECYHCDTQKTLKANRDEEEEDEEKSRKKHKM